MRRREGQAGAQLRDALLPLDEEDCAHRNAADGRRHQQLPSQFRGAQHVRHAHSQAESERKEQQRGDAAEHRVARREKRPEADQGTDRDQPVPRANRKARES